MSILGDVIGGITGMGSTDDATDAMLRAIGLAKSDLTKNYKYAYGDILPYLESSEKMLPYIEEAMARGTAMNEKLLQELGVAYSPSQYPGIGREAASTVTPEMQNQVDAWKKWHSGESVVQPLEKAHGYEPWHDKRYSGRQGSPWRTNKDYKDWLDKNREALEAMLPAGMRVEDIPKAGAEWILNPTPLDKTLKPIVNREGEFIDRWGKPLQTEPAATTPAQTAPESPFAGQTFEQLVKTGPGAFEESAYYDDMQKSMDYMLSNAIRDMGTASTASGSGYGRDLMNYAAPLADELFRQNRTNYLNEWVNTKYNPYAGYMNVLLGGQGLTNLPQMNAINTATNLTGNYMNALTDLTMTGGQAEASGILDKNQAFQQMLGGFDEAIGLSLGAITGGLGTGAGGFTNNLMRTPGGGGSGGFSIMPGGAQNNYGIPPLENYLRGM